MSEVEARRAQRFRNNTKSQQYQGWKELERGDGNLALLTLASQEFPKNEEQRFFFFFSFFLRKSSSGAELSGTLISISFPPGQLAPGQPHTGDGPGLHRHSRNGEGEGELLPAG